MLGARNFFVQSGRLSTGVSKFSNTAHLCSGIRITISPETDSTTSGDLLNMNRNYRTLRQRWNEIILVGILLRAELEAPHVSGAENSETYQWRQRETRHQLVHVERASSSPIRRFVLRSRQCRVEVSKLQAYGRGVQSCHEGVSFPRSHDFSI